MDGDELGAGEGGIELDTEGDELGLAEGLLDEVGPRDGER